MKKCARCGQLKPNEEFYKYVKNKDGLMSYCKKCTKEKSSAYSKTGKGKKSLFIANKKMADNGYYRFGKGAFINMRESSIKRGIEFNLLEESLTHWWHSQPDYCHYCRISIEEFVRIRDSVIAYTGNNWEIGRFKKFFNSPKHAAIKTMTIDRSDNSKGYQIDNLVKACWICNSLKRVNVIRDIINKYVD